MSFANKVVIVTGASSGIGAAAARHLANLGAKVVIVGRNEKRLNEVAELIKKDGSPTPLAIVADVSKDTQRIIDETIKEFGQLDVLINNAGYGKQDNIENIDLDEYDRLMDVNVTSVIKLSKLAVPYLAKTKGNILNVSSAAGLRPKPSFLSYCMSKAAVNQFTKCCALDLAPKRIRVNAINPVAIRTTFFDTNGICNAEETEKFFDSFKDIYPVGRVGETSDTSAAIEYLCGDQASFITGHLLPVDGGALTAGK